MHIFLGRLAAVLLILSLGAGLSAAQAQMPEPRTAGGVAYVAGGIGDGEVAAMRAQASAYSALIEFVEVETGSMHGNWTADIAVDVKSGKQILTSINVPGPMLLLRLPPGRYTIDATRADIKLSKVLEVRAGAKPLRERFIWRAAPGTLGNDLKK